MVSARTEEEFDYSFVITELLESRIDKSVLSRAYFAHVEPVWQTLKSERIVGFVQDEYVVLPWDKHYGDLNALGFAGALYPVAAVHNPEQTWCTGSIYV